MPKTDLQELETKSAVVGTAQEMEFPQPSVESPMSYMLATNNFQVMALRVQVWQLLSVTGL